MPPNVPRHEFTYEFTDSFARQASRRWLIHHFHWRARIALATYLLLLVLMCRMDGPGYLCGIFAGAGGLLVILVMLAYFVRVRGRTRLFQRLPTRTVRCALSESTLLLENALGSSSLTWDLFDKVVRAPDVWLFIMSRYVFVSLPADQLRGEVGRFIEERVVAAGGRIVGEAGT